MDLLDIIMSEPVANKKTRRNSFGFRRDSVPELKPFQTQKDSKGHTSKPVVNSMLPCKTKQKKIYLQSFKLFLVAYFFTQCLGLGTLLLELELNFAFLEDFGEYQCPVESLDSVSLGKGECLGMLN